MTKHRARTFLTFAFAAAAAVCLSAALAACAGDKEETTKHGAGEEGWYYYDATDSAEYLMSLQGGMYMISDGGDAGYTGTYSYDEEGNRVSFTSGDGEAFEASFADDAMQLSVSGTPYTFLKMVDYTVRYMDGTTVAAVQSVRYGRTAAAPDGEKDGYLFLGWYEDADFTTRYGFNSSVTGDMTLYGYYVEIDASVPNYEIEFVSGGKTVYTTETVNGVVYDFPDDDVYWWVSATNKEDELTYEYGGEVLDENTKLFAVEKGSLGASVYDDGLTWKATVSSVTVTIDGDTAFTASGYSADYDFASLSAGEHEILVRASGYGDETLVYVARRLARVSSFTVYGSVLVYNAVENAEYYRVTVDCGNEEHSHEEVYNGNTLTYDFSGCEMGPDGIKFTVYAYAPGYAVSVSDTFTYLLKMNEAKVTIDQKTDTASWDAVYDVTGQQIATGYEVYVNGEYADTITTTTYSLKHFGLGATVSVSVKPVAPGYWSEVSAEASYTKATLESPEITDITDYLISWTEIEGASGYEVNINGKIIDIYPAAGEDKPATKIYIGNGNTDGEASGYYQYVLDGTNVISVTALSSDGANSQPGDSVIAESLTMNPVLSYRNGTVSWEYVLAAGSYFVEYEGTVTEVERGNSFDVTFTHSGENVVKVYFNGDSYAEIAIYAYAVVFDSRGASAVDAIYVAKGDEVILPELSAEDYYGAERAVFEGWYTLPDLTGVYEATSYAGDGERYVSGTVFDRNTTLVLYAFWTIERVSVSLDAGSYGTLDGGATADAEIAYGSDTYTLPVPEASDPGKIFYGWYSAENGRGTRYSDEGGNAVSGTKYTRADGETLYAYWIVVLEFSVTTYQRETLASVSAGADADKVSELTVPDKVKIDGKEYTVGVVGNDAFGNCQSLVTVNLPDTVRYVSTTGNGYTSGSGAFANSKNIQSVNIVPYEGTYERHYYSADGVLFKKDSSSDAVSVVYYPFGRTETDYTLPSEVCNAFEYADAFGTDILQLPVTTIESRVFYNHSELVTVTIPSSVTAVYSEAFYSCTGLVSVVFESDGGAGTLTIGEKAFRNCVKLGEVTLPSRFTDFDPAIFTSCGVLENIYVSGTGGNYTSADGLLCDASGTEILYCPAGRSGTVEIGVFGTALENISAVGDGAFSSCVYITRVVIGERVSYIGESAFSSCTRLASIEFEQGDANSVKLSIAYKAFYGCTSSSLTEVTLPARLSSLSECAFGNCSKLTTVYYDSWAGATADDLSGLESYAFCTTESSSGTRTSYVTKIVLGPNVPAINFAAIFGGSELKSVEIDEDNQNMSVDGALIFDKDRTRVLYCMVTVEGTVTLPGTVTSIADNAFYNCAEITGVILDDGIQYIGAQAFYMCTSLAVINFPEGLREIGDEAFYGCSSLVSVSLPASLERMGEYNYRGTLVSMDVFEGCTSLESIEVAEGNVNFVTIDGVLYLANFSSSAQEIVATELLLCPLNNAVAEIEIPSTVTSIVANAFKGNTGITKVSFADGMITGSLVIGDNAFSGAVNLETIELPTGLTAIGAQMFRQCESLVTVTVPYTVTYIGAQAFFSCTSLEYVIFDETPEGTSEVPLEFDGGYEFADTPSLVSVALPDRTTGMTAYMFYYSGVRDVVIGADVESVPNYCFSYASDLQSVTFGEKEDSASKLKSIGNNSFSHTGGSFELVLPEGFTSFSIQSFYQSTGLKKIYIPDTCSSFSQQTFSGCSSLEEVIFEEGAASVNFTANQLFTNCTSLKRITIPASVTSIAASTFSGCESLEEVTFETDGDGYSSLASMGNYVFSGTGLKSFTFPDTDPSRSDGGAISFSADCEIFRWCDSLTEITLSNAVQSGLGDALGQAYRVTTINKGTCTAYEIQGCVVYSTTTGETAFVFGDVGEELTLPWQVTSVGDYAFQYVNTLKSVSIPVSTASIGAYAFDGCTALEEVTFYEPTDAELGDDKNAYAAAESVSLGKYCFRNCTSLKEIVLPENLTEIGTSISANGYQFTGCTKLEKVTLSSRTTRLSTYMFEGCTALKIITYAGDAEYDEAKRSEYLETGYMSLPSSTAMLGNSCFRRSGLVTALVPHIPSGTSGIGTYLFAECPNLVTVVFADGADALNTYMFYGCASLTEISVPSAVSSLPNYCFQGCTALRSVTIPEGITSVGTYLFDGCTSLESVELPATLTTITVSSSRSSLFQGCESLKNVTFMGNAVTTTTLGNYAFYGCSSLESVTLPSSITALGTYAFYGCSSLKYVDTSNVRTYGTYCFYGCSSLVGAELSGSTTSIGTYMFCGCASLETVTLGGTYTALTDYMFAGCTSLESVEIPGRITYLGTHTFQGCTSLKEMTLPSSLGALGTSSSSWSADGAAYTFDGCTSLAKVVLGPDVKGISGYVFRNCSALKIVTYDGDIDYSPDNDDYYMTHGYFALPSSLTTIGDYAFAGTGLTYVTLPAFTAVSGSTDAVGTYAFADCEDLVSVTFDNSTTKMSDGMFSGCTSLARVTVPSQVSALGSYQFDGCASLEEVSILGNATEISVGAFRGCTSLTEADVPGAVETIGDYAFCGCTSLDYVSLPDTVTLIGKHAFENCSALGTIAVPELTETIDDFAFAGSGLTEISLSEFVTYIGEAAFCGCAFLASVTIDSSNPRYGAEDGAMITDKNGKLITVTASVAGEVTISGGQITEIGEYAFYGADGITKIALDGVSVIDDNAFRGLGSLTEASLGGVTHIGAHAFEGTALTSVAIPSTVAEIGEYAFRGLEGLTEATFDADSSLTTIGEYAFAGTGLTSISFPESLTTVRGHAFEGTSLVSVTLGSGMTYVGEYAFADVGTLTSAKIDCATEFGEGVFGGDANLAEVTFGPNARTDVYDYMFYGCVSLMGVSLPESVTRIGSHAFEGTSLASVTLPGGVVSVGDYAFNAVESLTDVTMPDLLASVGDHAFAGTGVTSLSIPSSLETIGDYAFFGCAFLATIDLSAATALSLGAYAFADCPYLTAVTINPDTYLTIGDYAFANDTGIASVSISYENTASIGEGAFSGWTSTQTVNIDSSRYLASHKWMWTAKTATGEAAEETWIYGSDATFVYTG